MTDIAHTRTTFSIRDTADALWERHTVGTLCASEAKEGYRALCRMARAHPAPPAKIAHWLGTAPDSPSIIRQTATALRRDPQKAIANGMAATLFSRVANAANNAL